MVVQDLATQWIQSYPCSKTAQDTMNSVHRFLPPESKLGVIYTDNSSEFTKACEDFSWKHGKSTPHRSDTNGIAKVKERDIHFVVQSRLGEKWCGEVIERYCFSKHSRFGRWKTLHERRYDMPWHIIECGAKIFLISTFHRRHKQASSFQRKVADAEELRNNTASEVHVKRCKENDIGIRKVEGPFIFPCADSSIKFVENWSKISVDVCAEEMMMGERNMFLGVFQEASLIDIMV